jgi:hypothetical protein
MLTSSRSLDYSIHHTVLPLVSVSDSLPSDDKETHLLIAHMRYMGQKEDFEKDMAKVAEDPETQRWWKVSRCFRFLWVEKRRLNRSS